MRRAWLVVMVGLLPGSAAACTLVDGPEVRVRDLREALPGLDALADELVALTAPLPGHRLTVAGAMLAGLGRRLGVATESWSALCVERRMQELTTGMIEQAVRQALGEGAGAVEVVEFGPATVPAGALALRQPVGAAGGEGVWRGEWTYDQNRRLPVWARVRWTQKAASAAQVPERPVRPVSTARVWAVKAGQEVRLQVTCGSARLLLSGVALESGAAGQAVHVKTPRTGRVLRALVVGEGRMLLDVQGGSDE